MLPISIEAFNSYVKAAKGDYDAIALTRPEKFYSIWIHASTYYMTFAFNPITKTTIAKGRFGGEDANQFYVNACVASCGTNLRILLLLTDKETEESSAFCIGDNEPGNEPVACWFIIGDSDKGPVQLKVHWVIENSDGPNACCFNEIYSKKQKHRFKLVCSLINHFNPGAVETKKLTGGIENE